MSQLQINLSPDLKQLLDEGYDIEIRYGHLLIKNVPYVNSKREVKFGTLVSHLTVDNGDVPIKPADHVAYFCGEHPCNAEGAEIHKIKHSSPGTKIGKDLVLDHMFSAKPVSGSYVNFYEKMTRYVSIFSGPAQAIDPTVRADTFPVIQSNEEESVFRYMDTASSRVQINMVAKKLELGKIAIIGLGGTGSYILDLVAKTLVKEIHLFDGDKFSQHNAFRSPGAPSIEGLGRKLQKVTFFQELYSQMRRNVIPHDYYVDESNVEELRGMDFVFLCLDDGAARKMLVGKLEEFSIPFVDVGMGVYQVEESLGGHVRTTTSTAAQRESARKKINFSDSDANNEYSRNIQIADLNALNAALAVIKWKKLCGFYSDLDGEHYSVYTIDGNVLDNEDRA